MRTFALTLLVASALTASPAMAEDLIPVSSLARLTLPQKPLAEEMISYSGPALPSVKWEDREFVARDGACFRFDDAETEDASSVALLASHIGPTGRLQRIVGRGSEARLEIHEAWLDSRLGRSYVKRSSSIALTPIASGPQGAIAYAYRMKTWVHVVVPTQKRWAHDCGIAQLSLDLRAKDGDESRTPLMANGKRLRVSASVSRFGGEPRLSATFVER
jgi:hypothetical protein